MSVQYIKVYNTTCSGDLKDSINSNMSIGVLCEQIIQDGSINTTFVFATSLTTPQMTALDNTLATFVCPIVVAPADGQTLVYNAATADWEYTTVATAAVPNELNNHITSDELLYTNILSSGTISGGIISNSGGNIINITAGVGYVNTGTSFVKVVWNATSIATLAGGANHIGIDVTGVPYVSLSEVPTNIIHLGHVYANNTNTAITETFAVPYRIDNFLARVHDYVSDLTARVDDSGVTEKLSPNLLELNIGAGVIHSHLDHHVMPSTSAFIKLYNTTDSDWAMDSTNVNKVDTAHWNDFTQPAATALKTLTPGFWKKDIVVRVPDGTVFYIYSQQQYQTYEQASISAIPVIPTSIKMEVVFLVTIISQQGATTVATGIDDIRPTIDRVFGYGVEPQGGGSNGYSHVEHEHHIGGYSNSSTGLLTGGQISINGSNSAHFDVAAGSAVFIDNTTDPLKPTKKLISWIPSTNIVVTNIATQGGTYVGVDSTGTFVQSATPYTFEQTRYIVPLSFIGHPTGTTITGILPNSTTAFDPANRLNDLSTAVGVINISGNQYSANGTNLSINKTSGKSYALGVNFFNDKRSPDISSDPTITLATCKTIYRNGSGNYILNSSTIIDATYYDDGTGTLAAIPAGNWVSIPVYFVPGFGINGTYIQYPQRTFTTKADALANTPDTTFIQFPGLGNASLRSYVVVQQGATNLSNIAVAQFVQMGKFSDGSVSGGSSGGGSGAPVDASYIVLTADPTLTNEKVIGTDFFIANAHVSPAAGILESKLSLNYPTHTYVNDPTTGEKSALVGTTGTPGAGNRYVTDTDTRMTNARVPTSHEVINATTLGTTQTISGGVAGYVFKATGATTARLMQLTHSELGGIGTNTHAQIDTHVASTSNPHLTSLTNLTDAVITTPTANNLLSYNGTKWINKATVPSSASAILNTWTLVSGNLYYQDFTHNLGTQDVVVSLFNNTTNALVHADSIVITNTNTIRVTVAGNTTAIRIIVIANGLTLVGSGAVSSVQGKTGNVTLLPSDLGIPLRTLTYYATSLDSPNNADWKINALAPAIVDPTYLAFSVRQFSGTIEQGIGCTVTVPTTATSITLKFKGRAQTAPGAAAIVQPRLYTRSFPNNAAIGAWSAANELTNIAIPTNTYFQYTSQTATLASLGLSAGGLYQLEITRRISGLVGGTNLTGNWLLAEFTVEFN